MTLDSHINSVEKTVRGDYLVSARHTNTIYLVSGRDRTILWQLGGKESSFSLKGFQFSSQHDARAASDDVNLSRLTFFDNAADGKTNSSSQSSGMLVRLNHTTMTARLETQFFAPGGLLSRSQGNVQRLPNGNYFIGWGAEAYVSEHLPDGTCIFFANFGMDKVSNYRAYKFPWMGLPLDEPTLNATTSSLASVTEFAVS